ncbi:MAG: RQC domain-containing protein, partial [Anaerolineae bacterium]
MLGFAEAVVCRRRPLLGYFGEEYQAESCNFCDNCLADEKNLTDVTIPAQKFLSCVKRTGEIFGMTHVIDVLRGSKSQKVLRRRHDRLSTYGIGTDFSKKQWQHLARQFIQQGLLNQDLEHGSLSLTPKAYAVFKGEPVMAEMLAARPSAAAAAAPLDHDAALFAQLRAKRKELADAADVPPYVIFSDRSLVEMAAYFPQSAPAFAEMYGVGQQKLKKYADKFLPIIQAYCRERRIPEKEKPVVSRPVSSGGDRMTAVATLYNNGQSIAEIGVMFGVKTRTVFGHLWKAAQTGLTMRPDGFLEATTLTPEMQQRVIATFAELGTDYLRPVYEALDEAVDWDDLHLLRLYVVNKGE